MGAVAERNWKFKHFIEKKFDSQRNAASTWKLSYIQLNRIVNGYQLPSRAVEKVLRKELGPSKFKEFFPSLI